MQQKPGTPDLKRLAFLDSIKCNLGLRVVVLNEIVAATAPICRIRRVNNQDEGEQLQTYLYIHSAYTYTDIYIFILTIIHVQI